MNQQHEINVLAPIVLFTFKRPEHARRTLESLAKNPEFESSTLFVYCDGARNEAESVQVEETRKLVRDWPHPNKTIFERDRNWGLANSIIDGVTHQCNAHGSVIVLEDDMVVSKFFLNYMNTALLKYQDDDRVISIHGWLFPTDKYLPETFFLLGADCWGWATWRRGWKIFNSDGQYLFNELKRRKLTRTFDCNGAYQFTKMLEGQIKGNNDSWAVRWYASAFLAGKFTLYPGRSLVHNIGNDNSGTHCDESGKYDVKLSNVPIETGNIAVQISELGKSAFESFLRKTRTSIFEWILRKLNALKT